MPTAVDRTRETQTRAQGVPENEAGILTKIMFWRARRRYGHLPLSTRIRAHDTWLLLLAEGMSKYTSTTRVVSPRLKELVQLKVAAMVGCPF
jgi:hypothetical protein